MIVYLQKVYAGEYPQQQYPQQPEKKESHWVRNGLLATGALVGTHFGAKAGLLGRHMQKFAGNNQAWIGNKLGIYDIAKSGEKAATEAVAKMNAGVKGRGMSDEIWQKALDNTKENGAMKVNGQYFNSASKVSDLKSAALSEARKSKDVIRVDKNLAKEDHIRNIMDNPNEMGKYGINGEMDYKAAEEAFNKSQPGAAYNTKYGFNVQPTPPPAQ
jgi:hypothetical protein